MEGDMKHFNCRLTLKRRIKAFLHHPLTLLAVTAFLSYFIVPALAHKSEIRQQRLKRALELLKHDEEVNSRLNNVLTTLEIFHKDNRGVAARLVDYQQEQRELRKTMNARYIDFDRIAWWWYKRVPTEARMLGLIAEEETRYADSLVRSYDENLVATTDTINNLWNLFLRDEYNPNDKHSDEIMDSTRKWFNDLYSERTRTLHSLIELLASE